MKYVPEFRNDQFGSSETIQCSDPVAHFFLENQTAERLPMPSIFTAQAVRRKQPGSRA